ncbi:MAG: phosphoenolpyruvate--protein phosphotransferase [candidate division Zixibacteria bacterium]|nr:phosphoenolpyruvate--protein phosphotransferase [candidate division Zixibacteria bacterium]
MAKKRRVIRGMPISAGIALGRAQVILVGHLDVAEKPITASQVKAEIVALDKAVDITSTELRDLRDSASRKMSSSVSRVFDAQLLIATDQDFLKKVRIEIGVQRRNAGFVYYQMIKRTTHQLYLSNDQYMRQTAREIEAVADRILSHLSGLGEKSTALFGGDIIPVAKSLPPGEILSYRHRGAVGFLVAEGATNSHSALIARSLMLPMVVAPNLLNKVPSGCKLIIDGASGRIILNPTDQEWADYQKQRRRHGPAIISRIRKLKEFPPTTLDGRPVEIAANLEFPGPVDDILAERKVPVELYRTEFLYLDHNDVPGEIGQFKHYDRIAEKFSGTRVVFRTFDLGSDKVMGDKPAINEPNPALGWRGIRSMLELSSIFKTQVRAILRASTRRNVSILLPMISDMSEFRKARKLISQSMLELRRKGELFDEHIPIGIMIEVPSAALMAAQLVEAVDFVNIGTNDLTQYTMAADRSNSRVAGLYNAYHPSVLSLIEITVDACHFHNKPVCICGEVAGDLLSLPLFVGMGVTSLSMNPAKVFDSCRLVKKIDSQLVQHLVDPVLSSPSAASVMRKLQNYKNAIDNR